MQGASSILIVVRRRPLVSRLLAGVGVRGRDSDPRRLKCLSKWAGQQIPRSGELAAAPERRECGW
ncbi:hypothetical protein PVAP13_7NG435309 [Panicum virgatum]|uniref:Uncharacterized protein n=1 Tax=Panicum virgatum TaxID=38727 RepID=A0A8T0Q427_PANVG|nr:hypothetical protein PVAP13_7NG435309 [Panicum virgatum]